MPPTDINTPEGRIPGITETRLQSIRDGGLAPSRQEFALALAKIGELETALRSWEYEPDGQARAKLSNVAIKLLLDKAKQYMDERDALQEQVAARRLDTERLDWLETRKLSVLTDHTEQCWFVESIPSVRLLRPSAREAIDAARAAAESKE